jgi:predicted transcriptional regulator YheO
MRNIDYLKVEVRPFCISELNRQKEQEIQKSTNENLSSFVDSFVDLIAPETKQFKELPQQMQNEMKRMTSGRRVRFLKEKGMSVSKISDILGYSKSTIYKYLKEFYPI